MENPEELNKKETFQDEAISDEWREVASKMEADEKERSIPVAPEAPQAPKIAEPEKSRIVIPGGIDSGQPRTEQEIENAKNIRKESEIQQGAIDRIADLRKRQAGGEILSASEVAISRAEGQKVEGAGTAERKPDGVPESKPVEQKTPEQIEKDNAKKVEEARMQLPDVIENMERCREQGDVAGEKILRERAEVLHDESTGEKLVDKAKERAKEEAVGEGCRILNRQEFMKEAGAKMQEREHSDAVRHRWDGLSKEEQAKYVGEGGKPDVHAFAASLEKKWGEINKVLPNLSKDVYYRMMKEGYEPENIKIESKRHFGIGKPYISGIEVPSGRGTPMKLEKNKFDGVVSDIQGEVSRDIKERANEKANEARVAFAKRKERHAKAILGEIVSKEKEPRTSKTQESPKGVEKPEVDSEKEKSPEMTMAEILRLLKEFIGEMKEKEAKKASEMNPGMEKAKEAMKKKTGGLSGILKKALGGLMVFFGTIMGRGGVVLEGVGKSIKGSDGQKGKK